MKIELPEYSRDLWEPDYRHIVYYGGRGGAKSHTVATYLLLAGTQNQEKILCTREFQNSLADSVYSLLEQKIYEKRLEGFYTCKGNRIQGENGTRFIFAGLARNYNSIRSIEGLTKVWIEEAHTVSKKSLDVLIPTVRRPGSKLYYTYNPELEDQVIHSRFVVKEPPPRSIVRKVNWRDNPWFPEVLDEERRHMMAVDPELGQHVWEGECRSHSDAQIFKDKFVVRSFVPENHWIGPLYGLDFGFSVFPTAMVKMWIGDRNIYIEKECGGIKLGLDKTLPLIIDKIPEAAFSQIRGDCSRPESISFLNQQSVRQGVEEIGGVREVKAFFKPCTKWKGCEEDGIEFMRSFDKIVIHERCRKTYENFRKYTYKVDAKTEEVQRDIVDNYGDYIDAARYGLEKRILKRLGVLNVV